MIIHANMIFDVPEDFLEYHRQTVDTRTPNQIIFDMIEERMKESLIKVVLAEVTRDK